MRGISRSLQNNGPHMIANHDFSLGIVSGGDFVVVELSPPYEVIQEVITPAYGDECIQVCYCYFTLCIDPLPDLN